MKVYIGPYKNWIGPYQLAEMLEFFCVHKKDQELIGEWLSKTWVNDFCQWIDSKKKRKIKIKVDRWDSWNADSTIAILILPILKQLKESKHGAPNVDDEDVPEHLRALNASPKENSWDTDEFWFDRFDWVLGEIIWAFEQLQPDVDWEEKYYSGESDLIFVQCKDNPDLSEMVKGPNDTFKVDWEGRNNHYARMENGLRLFGKYYFSLWD